MHALLVLLLTSCGTPEEPASTQLDTDFSEASSEFGVPRDLLVSLAYVQTRMDDRGGEESVVGGVGLMNLRERGRFPSLDGAAELLGVEVGVLQVDSGANIRGGAAVLAAAAREQESRTGEPVDTLQEWYPIAAQYSGAADPMVAAGFAEQVYDWLEWGFVSITPDGQWIEVAPRVFSWRDRELQPIASSPLISQYVPASSSNYSDSSRSSGDIDMVVLHTVQGSYSGAISWFQNASSAVSSHYVV
ncbi:MAG: hypothetical protein QGG40_17075, partial [Myxococcota bacterium]|nr:hypothetical protein [Myxococcota bacterium]